MPRTKKKPTLGALSKELDFVAYATGLLGEQSRARITLTPSGEREAVASHVTMLAWFTYYWSERLGFDTLRAVMAALGHDRTEYLKGDMPTLVPQTEEEKQKKAAQEEEAFKVISKTAPVMAEIILDFEEQDSAETQLVHFIDRIIPAYTQVWHGNKVISRYGFNLEKLKARQAKLRKNLSIMCPLLPEEIFTWFDQLNQAMFDAVEACEN